MPDDTLACFRVESVSALQKALTDSPIYAGSLNGTWEQAGRTLLARCGIEDKARRPLLWRWFEGLAPQVKGTAVLAWTKDGPAALARVEAAEDRKAMEAWVRKEAAAEGLVLKDERFPNGVAYLSCEARRIFISFKSFQDLWCVAARDRAILSTLVGCTGHDPKRSLAASSLYRQARAAVPGDVFLYVNPGALAHKERAPFAEALGWGCSFGKDGGVTDTLRLLRPGRKALLPAKAPGRLAAALPANPAASFTGRLSGKRLREVLTCLLGQEPPLPPFLADWEGEVAFSAGWSLIFPDLLLGVEAANPQALMASLLDEAKAHGALVAEVAGDSAARSVILPGQGLAWVVREGDKAVWIGTLPANVTKAAKAAPAPVEGKGAPALEGSLSFPEVFGPLSTFVALQGPNAAPAAKLLQAQARWEMTVDEDKDGLTLTSRSPWGLMPLAGAGALGFQALDAFPVLEEPESVTAHVKQVLPGIRGLDFAKDIDLKVVTEAETHALFEKAFDKEMPPEKLAVMRERMLAFGLIKPDDDLKAVLNGAFVDLVGGFYDPETKGLYLIRGMPAQAVVAAHEMTHALQDQHFQLQQLQEAMKKLPPNGDRDAAFLAVVEGDATLAMQDYMQREMQGDPFRGLRILLEVADSPALALGQITAMRVMPDAMLRELLFSYEEGLDFVSRVRLRRGRKGVDALFADPPASTEQVLHPEKYLGAKRDDPVPVDLKDLVPGGDWKPIDEDTMGELGIQALLRHFLPHLVADQAAAGWGGDRFALFGRGADRLLIWRTVWDTEADGKEFAEALGKVFPRGRIGVSGLRVELRNGPEK